MGHYGSKGDNYDSDDFPHAKDLREESTGINNKRVRAAMEEMRTALRSAANKGETRLYYPHNWGGGVAEAVKNQLALYGYTVRVHDDQRGGYSIEVAW